jgi:hypothetical protein
MREGKSQAWQAVHRMCPKNISDESSGGEKRPWCDLTNGDGIREVHTNSAEGMWTGLRNFLRSFRGVHKKYLSGYVAVHECRVNLKRISSTFISPLVKVHSFDS